MLDFLQRLFDTSDFSPRWNCGTWSSEHGWLHILSDLGVWSAYFAIPGLLAYFVLRRRDLPFRTVFWLFGLFILACGTTHLMEAIIFWWPAYRLAGVIKLLTAVVSWATVLALVPVMPRALALRSPEELEQLVQERTAALARANTALQAEIVQRRLVEERLREQRERFRVTLESIGDGVIVTDASGRLTLLNPVAETLTGWRKEEAQGQALAEAFHIVQEETGQPAENPVNRVLREGVVVGLANHTILIARDGRRLPIDDCAAPIRDKDGSLSGVILVFRDVSERRRVERELKEADRRKDEFLALLSHELRNPLAPMRNAVLVLRLLGSSDPQIEWARDILERQLQHLSHIVDDLLDVSRITQGKIILRKEPVELNGVVAHALESCRHVIEARKQQLQVTLPNPPMRVEADSTRLSQVVMNLLGNAAKYTPEGGRIELAVERAHDEARIRVRDTGAGITAELLPRIFDPFTQAERTLDRSDGGLGIGLTLVRRLTEMHGGTVGAFSEGPGRGSEFIVRLPALPDAPLHPEAAAQPALAGGETRTSRILVVDDNIDAADSTAMLLRMRGHDVHTAYDGAAALEEARAYRPAVVLLDIGLPKMNGYEVARQLRGEAGLEKTVLIALTGYGQEQDRLRSQEAGFDHHLVKPVDFEALHRLLETLAPAGKV